MMNLLKKSLFALLCISSLSYKHVDSEWVDIPEFSNRHKVYKAPVRLHFPKMPAINQQQSNRRVYEFSTLPPRHSVHQAQFHRNLTLFTDRRPIYSDEFSFGGTIASFTTERIISSIIDSDVQIPGPFNFQDDGVDVEPSDVHRMDILPQINESYEAYTTTPRTRSTTTARTRSTTAARTRSTTTARRRPTTTTRTKSTTTPTPPTSSEDVEESDEPNSQTESDKGFLYYLPVDLLKRVHKTLKLQPTSIRGKIRFLKAFEQTLVSEIESRLSEALAPSRKPRDVGDHWDNNDSIAFPSLEGTLMAISFLTFAVYLVRLVMLLFRNTGTAGTAPIFVGRKKRSVDDRDEESARILSYLNYPFGPNQL